MGGCLLYQNINIIKILDYYNNMNILPYLPFIDYKRIWMTHKLYILREKYDSQSLEKSLSALYDYKYFGIMPTIIGLHICPFYLDTQI
jgi:hypothetical protein